MNKISVSHIQTERLANRDSEKGRTILHSRIRATFVRCRNMYINRVNFAFQSIILVYIILIFNFEKDTLFAVYRI